MSAMMIEYPWILEHEYIVIEPRPSWTSFVNIPTLLHRDWYGKPCGGTFKYAHRHSYFNHIGWWLCGLCSRKVCAYQPDPLMAAAQEAIAYV